MPEGLMLEGTPGIETEGNPNGNEGAPNGGNEGAPEGDGTKQITNALFDDKYQFNEGWLKQAVDVYKTSDPDTYNAIIGSKNFDTIKSLPGLIKSLHDTKATLGLDKIAIPKEGSPKAVFDTVYNALGRPETSEQYDLKYSEDIPISKDQINGLKQVAHKNGISQKALQEVLSWYQKDVFESELAAANTAEDTAKTETIEKVNNKYGDKAKLATEQVKAFIQQRNIAEILAKKGLGNDFEVFEMLYELSELQTEDKDFLTDNTPATVIDLDQEIQDIREKHPNWSENPVLNKRMHQLYAMKDRMNKNKQRSQMNALPV